jgi:hypothetical protein
MIIKTRPLTYFVLIACALISTTSCSFKIRKKQSTGTVAAHPPEDIAVSPNQIRLRMRSLVEPFSGEIEQSADTISAGTTDRSVKRAAIMWKIEGVPVIRGTLFQPDPFISVFDTWVFTYQMADYFETGPGRAALGSAAPIAVDTSKKLESEVAEVATSFTKSKDITKVRATARKWALDHPIQYAIRDRETALSRVTEQDAGVDWQAGEVIAEMAATADDLHREIQIYSSQLFRQARWETELLKLDLPTQEVLPLAERAVKSSERAATTLDQLTPTLTTAATAATTAATAASKAADAASDATSKIPPNIPTLIASERAAAVDAVTQDIRQTLAFFQGERIAAMRQVSEERVAALEGVTEERISVMKDVRTIANDERLALSKDIEVSTMKVVDHAAWILAEIVAATLVAVFVAAVLLLFVIRRLFFSPEGPRKLIHRAA